MASFIVCGRNGKTRRISECLGNELSSYELAAEDAALEMKLRAMGTPELKALHEASSCKEKRRSQALVVISSRVINSNVCKGQVKTGVTIALSSLNGVQGSLTFGPNACRHAFLQKRGKGTQLMGAILLVFYPVVTLSHESCSRIRNKDRYQEDRVDLYVESQIQAMHIGYAKDIECCGHQTKAGGKCLNIVNRVNGAFCHYHPPPDINRKLNVVRSVAYKEESEKQALKSNKEGLENMNTTNSTTMNIAAPSSAENHVQNIQKINSAGGQSVRSSGMNSIIGRGLEVPPRRENLEKCMRHGTTFREEHLNKCLDPSILSPQLLEQGSRTHIDTHTSRDDILIPFAGPTTKRHTDGNTRGIMSMGKGTQSLAMERAGLAIRKPEDIKVNLKSGLSSKGALATASEKRTTHVRACGISEVSGYGEEDTADEQALFGSGAIAKDGKVIVPSQSQAFRKCNAVFREQVAVQEKASGTGIGTGVGISFDTGCNANARDGKKNRILNGVAAIQMEGKQDLKKHGSDRMFHSVSRISQQNQNRRISAEQIERRRLGAEEWKRRQEKESLKGGKSDSKYFNSGLSMAGSVVVDVNQLNKNAAASYKPKDKIGDMRDKIRTKRKKDDENAEIEALLNRKSTHAEEEQDEWMDAFQSKLKKLEAHEYFASKENEVTFVKIAAFHCINCNFTTEEAPSVCRSKGHLVKFTKAIKRYFECRKCSARTSTMGDLLPSRSCQNCKQNDWRPCGKRGTGNTRGLGIGGTGLVLAGSDYGTRRETDSLVSRARDLDHH